MKSTRQPVQLPKNWSHQSKGLRTTQLAPHTAAAGEPSRAPSFSAASCRRGHSCAAAAGARLDSSLRWRLQRDQAFCEHNCNVVQSRRAS